MPNFEELRDLREVSCMSVIGCGRKLQAFNWKHVIHEELKENKILMLRIEPVMRDS